MGDKPVSDLISEDTKIGANGDVTGTLKYVDGWTEFSSEPSEQSGHFFPVVLDSQYSNKEIICTGTKETKATDLEWVLFVKDKGSTFTFKTDVDGEFLTLTFTGATFCPAPVV